MLNGAYAIVRIKLSLPYPRENTAKPPISFSCVRNTSVRNTVIGRQHKALYETTRRVQIQSYTIDPTRQGPEKKAREDFEGIVLPWPL